MKVICIRSFSYTSESYFKNTEYDIRELTGLTNFPTLENHFYISNKLTGTGYRLIDRNYRDYFITLMELRKRKLKKINETSKNY